MGYKRFQYDPNTIHTTAVGSKKSSHASFQMGDLIPVFARPKIDSNNINSFQMIWDGVFRFPSSVDGGGIECNDLNVIEFGVNIEESTCVRQVNHENDENRLETLCLTSLNVDQFVSNLYGTNKHLYVDMIVLFLTYLMSHIMLYYIVFILMMMMMMTIQ